MTESDLRDLASDVLASKKSTPSSAPASAVNRDIVAQNLALDNQQIDRRNRPPRHRSLRSENRTHRRGNQEAYWENIQDSFTTEPLRKFTYIIATPDMPTGC